MNHSEETVQRHEDQSVYASVGCHDDEVLYHFTPYVAERPKREDVVRCSERDAENDEEEIRDGKVYNEKVRGVSHLLIRRDDDDDKRVSEKTEYDDESEQYGHDDGDDVLHDHDLGFGAVLEVGGVAAEADLRCEVLVGEVGAMDVSKPGEAGP